MRKEILFIVYLTFLCLSAKSAQKSIRGRLIYRSCATIAIQVLDKAFFNVGQQTWKQAKNKPVYKHVFAVGNPCAFPDFKAGTQFFFKLIKTDAANNDCNTCMLFDNGPAKKAMIKVVTNHK